MPIAPQPREGKGSAKRASGHLPPAAQRASDREPRNKHQQRTEETRRKLLKSARRVFARVGFEAARLEDIAQEAGHTRGAFYAHFSSKEDLFFALLEQQAYQHLTKVEAILQAAPDEAAKRRSLREYYAGLAAERSWSMLMLEFKLFAARHPKVRAKLAETHRNLRSSFRTEKLGLMLSAGLVNKLEDGGWTTRVALEGMLHGLVLESTYDPVSLPPEQAQSVLGRIFDLFTETVCQNGEPR